LAFSPLVRDLTLLSSPFPFARRADGGRREAKESATLSLYTRRRRRRRRRRLVFAALAGKGLRLLAQAASTFARE